MTAYTKGAKRRIRRGRPRDEDVKRTPSGQKSRDFDSRKAEEMLALETATWRRRQDHPDKSVYELRGQEYGSKWHELHLRSQAFLKTKKPGDVKPAWSISREQFEVGKEIAELITAMRPKGRSASDMNGGHGRDNRDPFDAELSARDTAKEQRFRAYRNAVLNAGPFCWAAIEAVIMDDIVTEKNLGECRIGINAVIRLKAVRRAA